MPKANRVLKLTVVSNLPIEADQRHLLETATTNFSNAAALMRLFAAAVVDEDGDTEKLPVDDARMTVDIIFDLLEGASDALGDLHIRSAIYEATADIRDQLFDLVDLVTVLCAALAGGYPKNSLTCCPTNSAMRLMIAQMAKLRSNMAKAVQS